MTPTERARHEARAYVRAGLPHRQYRSRVQLQAQVSKTMRDERLGTYAERARIASAMLAGHVMHRPQPVVDALVWHRAYSSGERISVGRAS